MDPRGLEPLTSAMRERRDDDTVVYQRLKVPANVQILWAKYFQLFAGIRPGNCRVTVKSLSMATNGSAYPHVLTYSQHLVSRLMQLPRR